MTWTRSPGLAERSIDLVVPLLFGVGVGGAAAIALPLALGPRLAVGIVVLAAAAAAAAALLARLAVRGGDGPALTIADFELCFADDELLLDDPLGEADDDSRVVRLFAPETLGLPGELATRIDDWLAQSRRRSEQRGEAVDGGGHGPQSSAASAALHGALADIRRSLG